LNSDLIKLEIIKPELIKISKLNILIFTIFIPSSTRGEVEINCNEVINLKFP